MENPHFIPPLKRKMFASNSQKAKVAIWQTRTSFILMRSW